MSQQAPKVNLRIVVNEDCEACNGSGFRLLHRHSATYNTVTVEIAVCACVKLARAGRGGAA
jgi:hypothetical protein